MGQPPQPAHRNALLELHKEHIRACGGNQLGMSVDSFDSWVA